VNENNKADGVESVTIKDQDITMKRPEEIAPKSSTPVDIGKGLHMEEVFDYFTFYVFTGFCFIVRKHYMR